MDDGEDPRRASSVADVDEQQRVCAIAYGVSMATPNVVQVTKQRTPSDGFSYLVEVSEGEATEPWNVSISGTQASAAGFGDEGPPERWIAERFSQRATARLTNDRAVLEQLREWAATEQPFVITAPA